MDEGRYGTILGTAEGALVTSEPLTGTLSQDLFGEPFVPPSAGGLEYYSFETRKQEHIADAVGTFAVSADGKTVVYRSKERLRAIKKLKPDKEVYLRADQDVRYGLVMKTIAAIKQAGIERLGMVTRPPSEEG